MTNDSAMAESLYLREMAGRIAAAFSALPGARAALLFGSAAQGISDRFSDIDMAIYYDALAPEEAITAVTDTLRDADVRWRMGDANEGSIILAFPLRGVECQVCHVACERMESDMDLVLSCREVKTPNQKILSGVLDGIPLFGKETIAAWKAQAADYPDALARAMVEQHLTFFPFWAAYGWLGPRDITPWFYQTLAESVFNVLGVLAGVNRLYFSPFQFKRTGAFIAKMRCAPPALAARIEQIFLAKPETAVTILREIVRETVEIVEAQMPEIDTAATRRTLNREYSAWELPAL